MSIIEQDQLSLSTHNDEESQNEENDNNNEVANDIRDDKDNRKKDMENHISEHDVVLDMGSGNEALTLFNAEKEHILTTEFFIIDQTKEFDFKAPATLNIQQETENNLKIELFEIFPKHDDAIDFELLEVFNQKNNEGINLDKQDFLGLELKSYDINDYGSQEIIVYHKEDDAIYKEIPEIDLLI